MSQQISLWGATYSGVPAVTLPVEGGGTARFTDVTPTTATASDVATGKYFYAADGTLTLGTSSGGGGGSVTQDAQGYIVLPDTGGGGGGGGASNVVQGTFTTSSEQGPQTINIPYSGNGYPVIVSVFVPDGPTSIGGSGVGNYIIGSVYLLKSDTTTAPTYDGQNFNNRYCYWTIYTSGSTMAGANGPTGGFIATGDDATESSANALKPKSDTSLSVYVRGASYGFKPSTEYQYVIVYSE